ncbi:aspartate/glutamate racemase family protein [Clostridium paraputrificum]|uniref:aspartate/glutamate racemase family protein n=1 Tax=Clostridium paraputrificum TaxID=29363 RepID=UPI0018AA4AB5|nr:amino acid racemase [Clostridium paraputrificum]MDB2100719.1 amino acid racemase [Clostridium paraputrificum]
MSSNTIYNKLGVIGGMGPKATQLFMGMVIDKTNADKDQDHIPMVILNDTTIPDRTSAILKKDESTVLDKLVEDAKILEATGCSVIAVPCNTSHYFIDKVQSEVSIPIINMIKETVKYIYNQKKDIKKIAVLATDGTISVRVYQKELELLDIESHIPSKDKQAMVMDIIYNQVKKGQIGNYDMFLEIERELKEAGCDGAILACTELSCFREQHCLSDFYIDAMDILVDKSIEMCSKN